MKPKFFILGLAVLVALGLLFKHLFAPNAGKLDAISEASSKKSEADPPKIKLFSPEDLMEMIDNGDRYIASRFHYLGGSRALEHKANSKDQYHYIFCNDSYTSICPHEIKIIRTLGETDSLIYALNNEDDFNSFWQELNKRRVIHLPSEQHIGSKMAIELCELDSFIFKKYGFDTDYDRACIIVFRKPVLLNHTSDTDTIIKTAAVSQRFSYSTITKLLSLSLEQRKDLLVKMGFSYIRSKSDSFGRRAYYSRYKLTESPDEYKQTIVLWSNDDITLKIYEVEIYEEIISKITRIVKVSEMFLRGMKFEAAFFYQNKYHIFYKDELQGICNIKIISPSRFSPEKLNPE